MTQINLMINGLPGKVAQTIARHIVDDERFFLLPYSLTGPEIEETAVSVIDYSIKLVKPKERKIEIEKIKSRFSDVFVIDFTHPSAVNLNARFYIKNKLPFVMGTTGGDREKLKADINKGTAPAVVAPNMAKEIVGFQGMMDYAAETFPNLFKGYTLEIKESHQKNKADTSGTAKAMVNYFNKLGIDFSETMIQKERDPEIQKREWGVPEEHLDGHGFHTYILTSENATCQFRFEHNICGRDIYVNGSTDAVLFLKNIMDTGEKQKHNFYTMIDVLKQHK